ncbi:MAG: hypothetical protein JWO89_3891, partial [Verrucomicrobiaceae bacterium]|nr:hypothetical protein [Verrucomicrobiaceae bacterium]
MIPFYAKCCILALLLAALTKSGAEDKAKPAAKEDEMRRLVQD